jgi:hypothetical protein
MISGRGRFTAKNYKTYKKTIGFKTNISAETHPNTPV